MVRSANWVGDAVLTTPAVRAIRKNFERCRILETRFFTDLDFRPDEIGKLIQNFRDAMVTEPTPEPVAETVS